MSDTTKVKFSGSLFQDRVPAPLRAWLLENLDSAVWGAIETSTRREEGAVWLIVSASRNALAAVGKGGRSWVDLPLESEVAVRPKLARQSFEVGGKEAFVAGRIGSSALERLFELAFRPRAEGLYEAALDHKKKRDWAGADQLLSLAEAAVTSVDREGSVAFLSLAQKITLAQAACAMQLGHEGDALVLLAALSDDRPGDDLLRATESEHNQPGWLLTLALAHEEAGQPASAARVLAKLYQNEPEEHLLVLSRARALSRAGELDAAVDAYDRYVASLASDDFALAAAAEDIEDFVAACRESAQLLEELGKAGEAAQRYLTLIRRAPFEHDGYDRLFALRDALEIEARSSVLIAAEVLRLLNPEAAAKLEQLPAPRDPVDLPCMYLPIDEKRHDAEIVHETERVSSTLAQRWLGSLTRDERDTEGIERHAQRVREDSHPDVVALLRNVARLCEIDTPRLYLSHGAAGVEVLGAHEPFVLLGACHLDEADDRRLALRELAFTLGGQLEHIRADHVLLTSSEFWRTFGTKSATALLAFVPLGDVVSRLADGSLLKWVKKVGGTSSGPMRAALELAEARIHEGATGKSVQSAYTATLAKLRSSLGDQGQQDEESLVRERLADFARAAQYTADRVGLLAADDLRASVSAMIRLSPSLAAHGETFATGGLLRLLQVAEDDPALEEFTRRVAELLRFALSDAYGELRKRCLPV